MAISFRSGSNNWCHDFPKVARESGFNFNTHRSRVRVDWNRISCIDIDRVIAERDFSTVEQNVDNIVDCCLESEYDVKILEPNFVKLFRLAQLGVEYLLYCKRYLDRSVAILKDELRSKLEENVKLKNEIDALKSAEKRNRDTGRRANDSNGEIHKCPRCPKTFVSATFVNAHVNRRHQHADPRTGLEDSPVHKRYLDEAEKLHNEIKTLKERLNRTERVIRNESDGGNIVADDERETPSKDDESYKRYQREISQLKGMLLCEIRNLKRADATREVKEEANDSSGDNVKELIRRQEKEIERLRDELQKRLTPDIEGIHAKLENQEDFWQSKIDNLEARHRNDIEKLYSQLKVSHESVNEMRLDYTSKINDLEWRSRSESVTIQPQRKIQTRDAGVGETKEASRKDNYHPVREMRQRRDREEIRNESMRNYEDVPEVADDTARKDTTTSMSTDKYRQDDWRNAAISIAESTLIDRCGIDRRSNYIEPNNEKQQKDTSSLDSSETTAATTSESATTRENSTRVLNTNGDGAPFEVHKDDERFLGRTRRKNIFVEQSYDKSVEASSVFSSEESLYNLDDEVESENEETDEFRKKVKSNNRNNRVEEERSIEDQLNSKLRDLGIDPEWRAIPNGTFEQIINTIGHDRNFKCKKYHNFDEIRYKIIQQIARKLLAEENVARIEYSSKRSPLEKLVTNVKSKASRAMKILEKNEGSRRSVESARVERIKTLHKTGQRISEKTRFRENADMHSPRVVTIKSAGYTDRNTIVSPANELKHSYESIKDFVNDRKIVTSTPQRNERKLTLDSVFSVTNVTTNSNGNSNSNGDGISNSNNNNNKSVLKSTSASNGNRTVKKKVLFDLESKTSPEIEDNESEATNLSIYDSRDAVDIEKIEKTPQSGSIVLKTRQSERIAQISKEIEKQLSIPREKPAGAVEAMFTDKFYSKNDYEESMANGRCTNNDLSEGASRDSQHRLTSESRDSNLDMDIDELLEIQ